jgi:O-antigen/teichoic acid export membrane protein
VDDSRLLEASHFRHQMGNISRHSSVFLAGTIFTAAAGYLFKVYLARVLGANALGVYTLGMTIIGFLSIFNALGLPKAAVRFVATYRGKGQLDLLRGFIGRSILILLACNVVLGGIVLLAGSTIAVHLYHTPQLANYMGLFAVIMILGVVTTFLGEVLVGYKAVAQRTVITNFIASPATMLCTFLFVALGWGLRGYILAQIASASGVLILLAVTVWKLTPAPIRVLSSPLPPMEKQVFSFSAAVFSLGLLGFLIGAADKILIGFYLNAHSVGTYAVAIALVGFVPVLLQSVNQIFSPTIADLYARGQHQMLGRLFQTLTRWIFGLTIPLALVMMLFAPALMRIFGPEFENAWPILVIGTIGQLVNCGVGSAGTLLLMSGNQRSLIRVEGFTALLMVGLNILLIPRWGITGAAAAAACSMAICNFLYLYEVKRAMALSPYNRSYLRLIVPVAGSAIVLAIIHAKFAFLRPEWLAIALSLIFGYAIFIGISLGLGLDPDDRLIAAAVWSRVRSMFPATELAS